MFGADMNIDNGPEEEGWTNNCDSSSFFAAEPQQQPQPFGSASFGSAFPSSTSSWPFSFLSPQQPSVTFPSDFSNNLGSFNTTMSQGSPFANSASESLVQTSSVFSSSSFGDGSVTISNGKRKRKDKDKERMRDEGSPSPSERAQVKVVSKRMRLMKPFMNGEDTRDKALDNSISINVKTLSGKIMTLVVDPEDTIQELKEYLEEKSGVPVAQQRLIFRGKQVADTMTLAEGRVETGSVLHLVLALRGG